MKNQYSQLCRHLMMGVHAIALSLGAMTGSALADDQRCQETVVIGELTEVSTPFLELQDQYAYITSPIDGFYVVDVSDRSNPHIVGHVDSPLLLNRASVDGGIAAVKTRDTGVLLVDVSDPTFPQIVGHIESGREHEDIVVDGDILFAARQGVGVDVYDLSDLSQPSLITTFADENAVGRMELAGDVLFIAARQNGVVILDVSDHAQPQLLSQLDLIEDLQYALDLSVDQGLAVVSLESNNTALVDVQDPRNPRVLTFFPVVSGEDEPFSIAIDHHRVYLSFRFDSLYVFDISNSVDPELIGKYSILDDIFAMAFSGSEGYVGGNAGFQIVDVGSPKLVGPLRYELEVFGSPVEVLPVNNGDTLLVTDQEGGLIVLDVSDPSDMRMITEVDFDGDEGGFAVRLDAVWLAAGEAGVHWLSVNDPDPPTLLDTTDTPGFALDVELWANFAFVSDREGGVQIINLSAPGRPIVGSFQTPLRVTDVRVEDGVAYVNDPSFGVYILDVAMPSQPVLIGHIESFGGTNTHRIELHRGYLYMGIGSGEIRVFDVADPASPVQVGSHTFLNEASYSVVADDTMYIGEYALDISDPAHIRRLWRVDAGVAGMAIADSWLYIADRHGEQIGDEFGAVIALDVTDCRSYCLADLNLDQALDIFDIALFLVAYMNEDPDVDFNRDDQINFYDVVEFIESFQTGCP
jgi:hypothetical protein